MHEWSGLSESAVTARVFLTIAESIILDNTGLGETSDLDGKFYKPVTVTHKNSRILTHVAVTYERLNCATVIHRKSRIITKYCNN